MMVILNPFLLLLSLIHDTASVQFNGEFNTSQADLLQWSKCPTVSGTAVCLIQCIFLVFLLYLLGFVVVVVVVSRFEFQFNTLARIEVRGLLITLVQEHAAISTNIPNY